MHKYWFSVLFLFFLKITSGQVPELQWAKAFVARNQYNPSVYSNGRAIAVDQLGNVYSTGLFKYTTDFDPGPGVFTLTAAGRGNTSIYISKLSPTGDFLWAIQVPALVEFGNIDIRVDKDNNVYLASELRDPTDFDPGSGVYLLTPIGAWDAFVAKFNTNGNLIWAKQFGGPGDTVPRSDVLDIDDNKNVIVCGNFNNTVDFDPGPNVFNITSTAHIQSFIVKLNTNGDFIWARQVGNSPLVYSGANIADVKCDGQGNIYTVGNFKGICDFDPGPGIYTLQSTGMSDGYISKLDASGQFLWARSIGNTTNDYYDFAESRGIDVDNNNNVYTAGNFMGTFDFDPGVNSHVITSTNYDWYVLKLNGNGDFVWAAAMGDLSIRRAEPKEGIRGGHQDPAVPCRDGRGPRDSRPPAPLYPPGSRIQCEHLALLGLGHEHATHHGQWRSDRSGADAPDLLPIAPTQRVHLAAGAGGRREDGVARQEHPPQDHTREARRPAYLPTRQIHRVNLSVHAAGVQRVVLNSHQPGEPSARPRGPDRCWSIAGRRGGDRGRGRPEVHAGRVDASQEDG